MAEYDQSQIDKLPPDARARVNAALKRAIEGELASGSVGPGDELMAHSRSRGFILSRSRTTDSLREERVNVDRAVLRNLETLDDAAFTKFAERLATVKKIAKQ